MVDIQSVTAEIRRGKKEETGQKYNVRICYAGRPQQKKQEQSGIETHKKKQT